MACILHIETATKICSLTLSMSEKVLFEKINQEEEYSHASFLGVFAQEAINFLRENNYRLDAVSVSEGPGSYTGLRIGLSEAKGLCYGLDIPLIAIPTLEILNQSVVYAGVSADFYCPMIDARRMEVYSCVFDKNGNLVRDIQAEIIDGNSFQNYLTEGKVAFFGNGSDKCKDVISSENAIFIPNVIPLASNMISLAEKRFENKEFVDTAYFEPSYLKDFQATVAKNKVLGK